MKQKIQLDRLLLISGIAALPLYALRISLFGIPSSVLEVVTVLGFLYALARGKVKAAVFGRYELLGLLLLTIGTALGFLIARDSHALGIAKSWLVTPMLFYIWLRVSFTDKNEHAAAKDWLPAVLGLTVAWVSGYALLQLLWHQLPVLLDLLHPDLRHYLMESPPRILGHFESPNYLAMFLLPAIGVMLAFPARKTLQPLVWVATLLGFTAVVFTRSQGAYLGLLAALVVMLIPVLHKKLRVYHVPSWLVGASCLVLGILLFSVVYTPRSGGLDARREVYSYSYTMLKEHPVFGIGLGHFQQEVERLSASNVSFQTYVLPYALHAHNLYVTAWLELGIFGLLGLLTMIILVVWRAVQAKQLLLLAAFVAILVHGLVDTTFFKADLASLFWLIAALCMVRSGHQD